MNKFQRFLFKISGETCLKMDYFISKSSKLPTAGSSISRPSFRFNH